MTAAMDAAVGPPADAALDGAAADGTAGPSLHDRQALILQEPTATFYASVWWDASCGKEERAMLAQSRYVYDRPLTPMIVYEPDNELFGVVEELMASGSWLNRVIQDAATRQLANAGIAVTPIDGFTFFQDAHLLAREREFCGPTSIVIQQTFILPDAPGDDGAERFLKHLTQHVRGDHELPTLCDLMWLPQDANPFLLSATAQSSGYGLTLTYLRPNASKKTQIQEELKGLSARCLRLGGRVHLVKSVEVPSQQSFESTYHEQFERFRALKACYDPRHQIVNEFYGRVLGEAPPGVQCVRLACDPPPE